MPYILKAPAVVLQRAATRAASQRGTIYQRLYLIFKVYHGDVMAVNVSPFTPPRTGLVFETGSPHQYVRGTYKLV